MHRSNGGFDVADIRWAAGPRFVLGIPFADVNAIEFVYFGIDGLNGVHDVSLPRSSSMSRTNVCTLASRLSMWCRAIASGVIGKRGLPNSNVP